MNPINRLLNYFTMYRVVLYGLLLLVAYSLALSLLKIISFSFFELTTLLLIVVTACYISNFLLSKILRIPSNIESSFITALILYFLLWPSITINNIFLVILACFFAMISKYLIAFRGKQIFNPAAFGVFILAFFSSGALWWVGTISMLPPTLLIGFLILKKTRKIRLFTTFFLISIVFFGLQVVLKNENLVENLMLFLTSFPVFFYGSVMLTEPSTLPPSKVNQTLYAILAGLLFSYQGSFGPFILTTELSLLIVNIFSFLVSPKYRFKLNFVKKQKIARNTYEFVFEKPSGFNYTSGQYMDWTIPSSLTKADSRGNRRFFTIASSPTENEIKIGVKYNSPSSSFKAFLDKKPYKTILSGGLSGDFVLKNNSSDIVFIAGGIGITPFRSIIKYLLDKKISKNITLFYSNKNVDDIAYKDILGEASQKIGIKVVYLLTDETSIPKNFNGEKGRLNAKILKKYVSGFENTDFYLSGPMLMVEESKKLLRALGVKRSRILTDYFPGF